MPPKKLKDCKSDEIRNPVTRRCVKRNGAIGKALLATEQKTEQKPEQKKSPVYDDVKINKKPRNKTPAKSTTKKQASPRPFLVSVTLRKGNSKVTITGTKTNATYYLTIKGTAKAMEITSSKYPPRIERDTEARARALLDDICNLMIAAGYKNIETGTKAGSPKIAGPLSGSGSGRRDTGSSCPKPGKPVINHVDVEKCKNKMSQTMITMENLRNVEDKESIVMLGSGNCYLVDEIAGYWCGSAGVKDMESPGYRVTSNDMKMVLNHPKLDAEARKKLQNVITQFKDKMSIIRDNAAEMRSIMVAILAAGLLCILDYDDGSQFPIATLAIANLSSAVAALPDQFRVALQTVVNPLTGTVLQSLLGTSNTTCIHGVGYSLIGYALAMMKTLGMLDAVPANFVYYDPIDQVYAYAYPPFTDNALPKHDKWTFLLLEGMTVNGPNAFKNQRVGTMNVDTCKVVRDAWYVHSPEVARLETNRKHVRDFFVNKVFSYARPKDNILKGLRDLIPH